MYRPITYLIAKFFDELFITVFASALFATIVYFVVDIQAQWAVFWMAFLLTLTIGITLADVISIMSPNMDVANAALPTYMVRKQF
jgi:ATP-binding cassette, subfamily G (WHITE), member 2